jgi:DNA helicase HerA-like ATPase
LSNSISVEIDKVKPKLVPLSQSLPLFNEGVIESHDFKDDKKFGVKSYDFFRHSLIVGQSGCGKSMLISLLIKNIWENFSDDYSVVLIDPHESIQNLIDKKIKSTIIDFEKQSTNLFSSSKSPILSTELTCDLFSTVIPIKENPGILRLLKFSLVFLFETNMMNFDNLKKLLTDSLWRKENLKKTNNKSILDFFETEYQTIHTSQYSTVVLPILNLISEIDFIDSNVKSSELADLVNENFLTILPITKNKFGSRTAKIVGGTIIQQVFSLAQDKKFNKKIILIIDEMSIIQNPALIYILSEARKYGLTLILSQQYLYQVTPELLQSITTNVINYFCFKVNRGDAEIISRNLNMEIEEYFLKNKNDPREEMELGTKIITELNPQEIIVRIINKDKYCSPFKGKTVNVTNLN